MLNLISIYFEKIVKLIYINNWTNITIYFGKFD